MFINVRLSRFCNPAAPTVSNLGYLLRPVQKLPLPKAPLSLKKQLLQLFIHGVYLHHFGLDQGLAKKHCFPTFF
jgi:hypothetical protein